jgi:hypothetical protein
VRSNFFGAPPRGGVHAVFPPLSERGMIARVLVERASKILRTHCVASHLSQTFQHERIIDRDLCDDHDAGRRDQADHELAVERGQQGDRDDPAGRDRISGSADDAVTVSVAMSRRTDVVGVAGSCRLRVASPSVMAAHSASRRPPRYSGHASRRRRTAYHRLGLRNDRAGLPDGRRDVYGEA